MKLKRKYLIIIMINMLLLKLMRENFAAKLKQAKLATKDDIADFAKKTNFDEKLKKITKELLEIKRNMSWSKKTK